MSLRDRIAIAAMQSMLSRASIAELETTYGYSADECSQDAYIYADAMLRERKKKRQRATEFREILDQSRGGVQAANLDDVVRPDKLKRWTDFVSARVASLRAKSGMTQVELEKKTGLPQSHISRIESGKLSPSRATLEKLATAFGVSLNRLEKRMGLIGSKRQ